MINLHRAMASGTTALDLPFGGLTITLNPQYQRLKLDQRGYHCPNYFARLVSEMGLFQKFATEANN